MTRWLVPLVVLAASWALAPACTTDEGPDDLRVGPASATVAAAVRAASTPSPAGAPSAVSAAGTPMSRAEQGTQLAPLKPMTAAHFPVPPDRDLVELARQLRWKGALPDPPPTQFSESELAAGAEADFWVANLADREMSRRQFRLALVSDHAYWWVEDDSEVAREALQRVAAAAEIRVFPRVSAAFASADAPSDWTPARVHIINGDIPGVGGYVSGSDAYPSTVARYSNAINAVYINTDAIELESVGYLATLAHELQHVIHGQVDASESSWLNEGLSELAVTEAGYETHSLYGYARHPATSVVNWPADLDGGNVGLNYGAASLFAHYLREHYASGDDLAALVAEPADGIAGVDAFLDTLGATTSDGGPASFASVFADWMVANWLDQEGGRHGYHDLDIKASSNRSRRVGDEARVVALDQFGVDYVTLRGVNDSVVVHFEGEATTPLLPAMIPGDSCWWSNRGDNISSTLTRAVSVPFAGDGSGPPELSFLRWHELEEDWDYVYVEVSADGGDTWDVLAAEGATDANPMGNNYGYGYTGSAGWQWSGASLGDYAGREALVRFHYVTDDAIHGPGFCVRDMRLSGSDENLAGGWYPEGFVLVNNLVRQDWIVWIIADGDAPTATRMTLDYNPQTDTLEGWARVELNDGVSVVVAVAPLAPATTEPGHYRLWATE